MTPQVKSHKCVCGGVVVVVAELIGAALPVPPSHLYVQV